MRGFVLFVNSIIVRAMQLSKPLCYFLLFNLIVEFAIIQAIAGKYSDCIKVAKPFRFEGYYIEAVIEFD